jgi:hypothetical protein
MRCDCETAPIQCLVESVNLLKCAGDIHNSSIPFKSYEAPCCTSRAKRTLLLVQIRACCALSGVNNVHLLVHFRGCCALSRVNVIIFAATVTPFWRRDGSSQMLLSQVMHCTEQEEAFGSSSRMILLASGFADQATMHK